MITFNDCALELVGRFAGTELFRVNKRVDTVTLITSDKIIVVNAS